MRKRYNSLFLVCAKAPKLVKSENLYLEHSYFYIGNSMAEINKKTMEEKLSYSGSVFWIPDPSGSVVIWHSGSGSVLSWISWIRIRNANTDSDPGG